MRLIYHGTGLYQEGQSFGKLSWPHHDLFVVASGSLVFATRQTRHTMNQGDAIWIQPHVYFEGTAEQANTMLWVIHFESPGASIAKLFRHEAHPPGALPGAASSELSKLLMERFVPSKLQKREFPPEAEHYLAALLTEMTANAELAENPEQTRWNHLINWVQKHLDQGIGVEDLAQRMQLSESHFRKKFRSVFGLAPGDFLHQLRLAEARRLLAHTQLTLKQISAALGYADHVAFHRFFATATGLTPRRYRLEQAGRV